MGGYGSGTWRVAKNTIEVSTRLDIRYMKKQGLLISGMVNSLSWECNGKPSGSIGYRVYDEKIILNYDSTFNSDKPIPIQQIINFEETPCNYGSTRKWFLCPHCGSRREVLYLHGRYFTCRKCAELNYQCQQEDAFDRKIRQAHKIKNKLKTDKLDSENIIFKPKGMHQTTFDNLVDKRLNYLDSSLIDASHRMLSLLAKTAKLYL